MTAAAWQAVAWSFLGLGFSAGVLAGFELHHLLRWWRRRAINRVINKFR